MAGVRRRGGNQRLPHRDDPLQRTRGRKRRFSLEEFRRLPALAGDPWLSCSDGGQLARHHLADIQKLVRDSRCAQPAP